MIHRLSRRSVLRSAACLAASACLPTRGRAAQPTDATFLFTSDIHACRIGAGLAPKCQDEGKTDDALRRHIAALNALPEKSWPDAIGNRPSGLGSAGKPIGMPLGLVVGGDMTDDGGGQVTLPSEGQQLLQFSQRYAQGAGPDRIHFPVYAGMGNHDLDQDGPAGHTDWYRREMRDYVELNHRPSVIFKPPVPAGDYDVPSDDYAWDWGDLHLVQLHRFGGDMRKAAASGLPWLEADLAANAGGGRPVILFQHYGWDRFSTERWDPGGETFTDNGSGAPHWWSEADRTALLQAIRGYNVIGLFHGHEHPTPMIYKAEGLDLFKPVAGFLGGFALVRVFGRTMDVALGQTAGSEGGVAFTGAFSKTISVP